MSFFYRFFSLGNVDFQTFIDSFLDTLGRADMLWITIMGFYNTLVLESHVCIVLPCFVNGNILDYISD